MSDEFDVLGELPSPGVTVLEASAGTGKTYTIAALATRYVAEGTPLDKILVVTFTRMATGELRERVRERLVSAEAELSRVLAGAPVDPDDAVAVLLASEDVQRRQERLARAIADFDAATITTTHGFCQEVLGSLGFAGDVERDCTFVEDVNDLMDEVVDDLYVRKFSHQPPAFPYKQARRVASVAVNNPGAVVVPEPVIGSDLVPEMRSSLATQVRLELEHRKRRLGVMTYDDLLTRLRETLRDPDRGAEVANRLRDRYRVVLVDEFQDTDPVQWDILRDAFGHDDATLVLIGDPKQAIYAFRGADVFAYLDAAEDAARRATLTVNYRSDQPLLTAYDAIFGAAQLGHPGIVYRQVRACDAHETARLSGSHDDAPLRLRVVPRGTRQVGLTNSGYAPVADVREQIAADLAADLVTLLESGATIDGTGVRPGDVAVLVRRNRDAATIRQALEDAGVPAVINGAGSVFAGDPALDWLRLLEALERPSYAPRARAAALTPFFGWSPERVASAEDAEWEDVHQRLHHWAQVLRVNGVASLFEVVTLGEGLPGRVLTLDDGERRLTDLRHVGQLLHAEATSEHLGVAALVTWLRRRIAEAGQDPDEERSRRLESDAAAVQVLTIHRAKGLEFPIVYYPSLWEPTWIPGSDRDPEPIFFHDEDAGLQRTVDVGLDGAAYVAHRRRHELELRGEDLRLAYVALTRAKHQAIVWWAGSYDSQNSPLSRLIFDQELDGSVPPMGRGVPTDEQACAKFASIAKRLDGCASVAVVEAGGAPQWSGEAATPTLLSAAVFDRHLDLAWRRTSYSDITSGGREAHVASEPEEALVADEDEEAVAPAAVPSEGLQTIVGLDAMTGGVHVGTLLHDVYERTDFAAADLVDEVAVRLEEARTRRRVDVGEADVVAGVVASLQTPLGPLVDDLRLCDIARADRLDELVFELPLAGGDEPVDAVTPGAIGALLRECLAPGDPLHGYADRLEDPDLRGRIRGFLTGSIDLAFRIDGRYGIVDYKTNRLSAHDEPLQLWHHRPEALTAVMYRSHYALQGLLYTVALHRYLRWRVPGYTPETHLAGVFYCFIRGMVGEDTPRIDGVPLGVFAWRPPGELVERLSDLLDRGGTP